MRKPLIAGNWKMHLTLDEAVNLSKEVVKGGCGQTGHTRAAPEFLVCPPYTALVVVREILKDSPVRLGAQNMHAEPKGAFTGEVSPVQLKDAGCEYVLLGHSERRQHFGETDEGLRKKLESALAHGLKPVLCIGENLDQREDQKTFQVLKRQAGILKGMDAGAFS